MKIISDHEAEVVFAGECYGGPWNGDTVRSQGTTIDVIGPFVEYSYPMARDPRILSKRIGSYEFGGPGLWLWVAAK